MLRAINADQVLENLPLDERGPEEMLAALFAQGVKTLHQVSIASVKQLRDVGMNTALLNEFKEAIRKVPGHEKFFFDEADTQSAIVRSASTGGCFACTDTIGVHKVPSRKGAAQRHCSLVLLVHD